MRTQLKRLSSDGFLGVVTALKMLISIIVGSSSNRSIGKTKPRMSRLSAFHSPSKKVHARSASPCPPQRKHAPTFQLGEATYPETPQAAKSYQPALPSSSSCVGAPKTETSSHSTTTHSLFPTAQFKNAVASELCGFVIRGGRCGGEHHGQQVACARGQCRFG